MSAHRILLLSNARPSRTWRLAERIMREIAEAEICGIIQRPQPGLPIAERLIAAGRTDLPPVQAHRLSRLSLWFDGILQWLLHSVLWCIHGCPSGVGATEFMAEHLAGKCDTIGCPLLVTDNLNGSSVVDFIHQQQPDLGLLLGEIRASAELVKIPRLGWIRASQTIAQNDAAEAGTGIAIRVESFTQTSDVPFIISQLTLPQQPYDGGAGPMLKANLVSDDLTVQSTLQLLNGTILEAAKAVGDWVQETLVPCLEQLKTIPAAMNQSTCVTVRHRPIWKLCFDTVLLCSPWIVVHNWYCRFRQRYPVTVLTHHLVSDRPHRMGISTESFWQQVRFLQTHYRLVSLAEAAELLKSGRVEAPTATLTFDDGYADNFVGLRAVAEETGIPVTLFVATQPVELQQEFQHDLENGIHGALPLTWSQIRYWSQGSAEFGSHTRTHFDCGSHDGTKLEWEIAGSRHDLEHHLGRPVEFFAFPFGHHENISSEALALVKTCYRYFVSGFGGTNRCGRQHVNEHLLRKCLYASAWELELELQGVFDFIDHAKGKLRRIWPPSVSAPAGLHSTFPAPCLTAQFPDTTELFPPANRPLYSSAERSEATSQLALSRTTVSENGAIDS